MKKCLPNYFGNHFAVEGKNFLRHTLWTETLLTTKKESLREVIYKNYLFSRIMAWNCHFLPEPVWVQNPSCWTTKTKPSGNHFRKNVVSECTVANKLETAILNSKVKVIFMLLGLPCKAYSSTPRYRRHPQLCSTFRDGTWCWVHLYRWWRWVWRCLWHHSLPSGCCLCLCLRWAKTRVLEKRTRTSQHAHFKKR